MSLKFKVNLPMPDDKKGVDAINRHMAIAVTELCKKWVLTVTANVPVYTGASKASFIKLANEVSANVPISPVAPSRIDVGIAASIGELNFRPGESFGWVWASDLEYIHIVDQNNGFIKSGDRVISAFVLPPLPNPLEG